MQMHEVIQKMEAKGLAVFGIAIFERDEFNAFGVVAYRKGAEYVTHQLWIDHSWGDGRPDSFALSLGHYWTSEQDALQDFAERVQRKY